MFVFNVKESMGWLGNREEGLLRLEVRSWYIPSKGGCAGTPHSCCHNLALEVLYWALAGSPPPY